MSEFVEECRREWRRLGVPDPIANEMAADLAADIQEAESEGGSAEDVLGTSLFDPRRFAAAWASARGVTAPPVPDDRQGPHAPQLVPGPEAPGLRERSPWYRPVMVVALAAVGFLTALAVAALAVGRHSVAVAASARWAVPAPAAPPIRFLGPGPMFSVQNTGPVAVLAFALLLAAIVILALAVLYWSPWSRRESKRRLG